MCGCVCVYVYKATEFKDATLTENITEKEIAEETSQKYEVNVDMCCKDDDKSLAKQSSTDSVSSDSQTASSPKFSYFYQGK